jgi:AcrR family transcriptional regulator
MAGKRKYDSKSRMAGAERTKKSILGAAKRLFSSKGFDNTTIDAIAVSAKVSTPTVYTLFKSKEGIMRELLNTSLFGKPYQSLVEKTMTLQNPIESLKNAPSIARMIHDAEKSEMGLIRGVSALSPQLKKIEAEQERQRYERQENTVMRLEKEKALLPGLDLGRARDILWTLTSREVYRMLVMERGWSSDEYESWLRRTLLQVLIVPGKVKPDGVDP